MSQTRMKLIFNADDFGMRKVTTDSILEMYLAGVIKSTTILANFPKDDFDYAVKRSKEAPELGIGVHLNITEGRPLTGTQFPYCDHGVFWKPKQYYDYLRQSEDLDLFAIEEEFLAQIDRVISAGIDITHIDSHHHMHYKTPCIDVAEKLADRLGVPLRMPREYQHSGNAYADDFVSMSKIESYEALIEKIIHCQTRGDKIVEFGCHPTRVTDEMWKQGGWLEIPNRDWVILNNECLVKTLNELGVGIVSFRMVLHGDKKG